MARSTRSTQISPKSLERLMRVTCSCTITITKAINIRSGAVCDVFQHTSRLKVRHGKETCTSHNTRDSATASHKPVPPNFHISSDVDISTLVATYVVHTCTQAYTAYLHTCIPAYRTLHTAHCVHAYCMPIVDTKARLSFVHKTAERLSLCWINKPVST
jgi:hypothetical protein